MPRHLLVLNLGPVQGFIATARRTRDLWFGSFVLSEVSKAAAQALHAGGSDLIFPAPEQPDALKMDSDFNVANRVLAEIADGDPSTLLQQVKDAAQARWVELAGAARDFAGAVWRDDTWRAQLGDVIEISGAWAEWPESSDFHDAYSKLVRIEKARKATRDFAPAALAPQDKPGFGLPKSALDGARETVLLDDIRPRQRRKLGLGGGEQLDLPGMVKRLCGGRPEPFTAITRIALDPWLEQFDEATVQRLCAVTAPFKGDPLYVVSGVENRLYNRYPFDAQLLLPSRLEVLRAELMPSRHGTRVGETLFEIEERTTFTPLLDAFAAARRNAVERYGEPSPYVALLLADGDRMGALLSEAAQRGPDSLRAVSRALAEFAGAVPGFVEAYRGQCVYAGGDDVLALLPLPSALECARALHECFAKALSEIARELKATPPTLSVGIAVQHALSPLGEFRDLAKRAEKLAKGDGKPEAEQRDALGIVVQTRSGAPLAMRAQWESRAAGLRPDERLATWAALIAIDSLPDGAAFDLQAAAATLGKLVEPNQPLAVAEAKRILARKRTDGGTEEIEKEHRDALSKAAGELGLKALADELAVSRWFSRQRATRPQRTPETAA